MVEDLIRKKFKETISEEDIVIEMLEHDFVIKMPPKKIYKIQAVIRSITKGKPRVIEPEQNITIKE